MAVVVGGGATGPINDFVEDLSNLSGSATLVSSYSNLLSDFQSVVSNGDISAIQGVITGPDAGRYLTSKHTSYTIRNSKKFMGGNRIPD